MHKCPHWVEVLSRVFAHVIVVAGQGLGRRPLRPSTEDPSDFQIRLRGSPAFSASQRCSEHFPFRFPFKGGANQWNVLKNRGGALSSTEGGPVLLLSSAAPLGSACRGPPRGAADDSRGASTFLPPKPPKVCPLFPSPLFHQVPSQEVTTNIIPAQIPPSPTFLLPSKSPASSHLPSPSQSQQHLFCQT